MIEKDYIVKLTVTNNDGKRMSASTSYSEIKGIEKTHNIIGLNELLNQLIIEIENAK